MHSTYRYKRLNKFDKNYYETQCKIGNYIYGINKLRGIALYIFDSQNGSYIITMYENILFLISLIDFIEYFIKWPFSYIEKQTAHRMGTQFIKETKTIVLSFFNGDCNHVIKYTKEKDMKVLCDVIKDMLYYVGFEDYKRKNVYTILSFPKE